MLMRYPYPGGHFDNMFDFLIDFIEKALNQCNIKMADVHAFSICVPLIDNEQDENGNETTLRKMLSNENVIARNDAYGAWRAETNRLPSGVLAAGTGAALAFFFENNKSILLGESVLSEF